MFFRILIHSLFIPFFVLSILGIFCAQNTTANTASGMLVGSGASSTGSTENTTHAISFPEIIPNLQRWSYASLSGNTLQCGKEICRINLTFEQIFNDNYPKNAYSCEIYFENETIKKCNPPQWTLTGSSEFEIKVIHKESEKEKSEVFTIEYFFEEDTSDTSGTESKDTQDENTQNTPTQSGSTSNTGSISASGSTSSGGVQDTNSGSTSPETSHTGSAQAGSTQTEEGIDFPEIIPNLQHWSYASLSGNTLTCDRENCKINLTFEQIFNDNYPKSEYSCEIYFENETIKKCNPPQWTLTGRSEFEIKVIHKESEKERSKIFMIEYFSQKEDPQDTVTESGSTSTSTNTSPSEGSHTGAVQDSLEPIEARSLTYADTDDDKKIDTLFLEYSESLTGSYQTGSLLLFSHTGGLYNEKINSQPEKIKAITASGNILVIAIEPSDFEKKILSISASTSSDLRLKNTKDIGFRSTSGATLKKLTLTKSFEAYTQIMHPEIEIFNFESFTGSSDFPKITPTLQRATDGYLSGNTLICDRKDCRVNLSLETLFTGSYERSRFDCEIQFGSREILNTCNPPQMTLSDESDFFITLIDTEKGEGIKKTFQVEIQEESKGSNKKKNTQDEEKDANPPVVIVEMDGKWKDYFVQREENYLECYSNTCSINLTGENSYDPEGSKLEFLWLYDYKGPGSYGVVKRSKDPGAVKFGLGKHKIRARVTDASGNISLYVYTVEVLGKKETQKEKEEVKENTSKKGANNELKMPEIVIQNEKYARETIGGEYICESSGKTCSVNFTLSGTMQGLEYEWHMNDEVFETKNPRSQKYTFGMHTGSLLVKKVGSSEIFGKKDFIIRALQKKKTTTNIRIDLDNFPDPKIMIQNDTYLSWTQNKQFLCRSTRKTCSANLKIEDPIQGLDYIWYFDGEEVASNNPRSKKFDLGWHTIELKIFSENLLLWNKVYTLQAIRYTKPKKIYPFQIPEIVIQNEKYAHKEGDNFYICTSTKDTCSINFMLENTVKGYTYYWKIHDTEIKSSNPRSQRFSSGEHTILLFAKNANEKIIWEKTLNIEAHTKQKNTPENTKTNNYETINAQNNEKPVSTAHISLLSIFLALALFRREKKGKPS